MLLEGRVKPGIVIDGSTEEYSGGGYQIYRSSFLPLEACVQSCPCVSLAP